MPEAARGASGRSRRTFPVWRSGLVADTDIATGRLISRGLLGEGFRVVLAFTGKDVLDRIDGGSPDAVILGSDLPDIKAINLIRLLSARSGPPLLMLLDQGGDDQVARILDAGAGDCMRKPFLVGELAARLRKLVRRQRMDRGLPTAIQTETLSLDCVLWRATVLGVQVRLSVKEQAVLQMLVGHAGHVVSTRDMLGDIWGSPSLSPSGRVPTVVRSLRRKLNLRIDGAVRLLAVPQVGYRLVLAESSDVTKAGSPNGR